MATIFVGDIHGCAEEFHEILDRTGFREGRDRLLLTGDAFSRGPDPVAVWNTIRNTGAEMVLGNHDDRLIRHLRLVISGRIEEVRKPHHRHTIDLLGSAAEEILP